MEEQEKKRMKLRRGSLSLSGTKKKGNDSERRNNKMGQPSKKQIAGEAEFGLAKSDI